MEVILRIIHVAFSSRHGVITQQSRLVRRLARSSRFVTRPERPELGRSYAAVGRWTTSVNVVCTSLRP